MRKRAEWTMTIAVLLAPLAIFAGLFAGSSWEHSRDSIRPSVNKSSEQTLELVGARGDELAFYITGPVLGAARWDSSTGVTLDLEGHSYLVVAPRKKDWGGAINVGNGATDSLKIKGSFTVPDLPLPESQTVTGSLTGEIRSPQPSGSGFSNQIDSLNIPVELKLVSHQAAIRYRHDKQGSGPNG